MPPLFHVSVMPMQFMRREAVSFPSFVSVAINGLMENWGAKESSKNWFSRYLILDPANANVKWLPA